jgi:hypothetical protein
MPCKVEVVNDRRGKTKEKKKVKDLKTYPMRLFNLKK